MNVVLDTNVLIAAFIARGLCSDLLEHCAQRHTIVTSDFILGELHHHLVHKFNYPMQEADEVTALLRSNANVVIPVPWETRVCRDPDDDLILATAIAGEAQCIVTGDQDLLVLKEFRGIRIVAPTAFAEYEASSR